MKIAGGLKENGIEVGNTYDKYKARNPVARLLMSGFNNALTRLVKSAAPTTIHEVGCGEGYWVLQWKKKGFEARGTDFSSKIIEIAQANAIEQDLSPALFDARSIYALEGKNDGADLVVCCEVLEHLEDPAYALSILAEITEQYIILSVPREPLWRLLNLARGKYIKSLGNTPGHVNHWSKNGFLQLVEEYFQIVEVKTPLPWTMVLCQAKR
jgi:2-polyprenyl-3-methyl-5-hydroxy-6-metoxy-1,4-benzoquinol methylase